MYYVYEHYKKGTEEVFYVGIGNNIGKQQYSRAKSKIKRNPHWKNINNKYVCKRNCFKPYCRYY